MKTERKCLCCGKQFSFMTIINSWPANIQCKSCKSKHYYKQVGYIAIIYYLIQIPSFILVIQIANLFSVEKNYVYDNGVFIPIIFVVGIMSVYYILGSIYIYLIEKKSTLKLKET